MYLSIYLSINLAINLSIYLSIHPCLSIYRSIYLSICLSSYLYIQLAFDGTFCLSVFLCVYVCMYRCICQPFFISRQSCRFSAQNHLPKIESLDIDGWKAAQHVKKSKCTIKLHPASRHSPNFGRPPRAWQHRRRLRGTSTVTRREALLPTGTQPMPWVISSPGGRSDMTAPFATYSQSRFFEGILSLGS